MADTQMGEDGVGREESGGEESSAPLCLADYPWEKRASSTVSKH